MSNLKNILTPSGGLSYHVKAYKNKKNWQDFKNQLHLFLNQWAPKTNTLNLIGPSGGYNLKTELLNHYKTIHCYDPDLFSHYIFKKNHKTQTNWKFKKFNFELNSSCNECYLFSNLLGQLPAVLDEKELHTHNEKLQFFLTNTSWASYHDVYSWNTKDQRTKNMPQPKDRNFQLYFEKNLLPRSEVVDHRTEFISDLSQHKQFFLWPLTPKRTHLIECCYKD